MKIGHSNVGRDVDTYDVSLFFDTESERDLVFNALTQYVGAAAGADVIGYNDRGQPGRLDKRVLGTRLLKALDTAVAARVRP